MKETVIAIDVFGRDASFDPGSDSIVRSNIYNLRKKLESYYFNEGTNDAIHFDIPKGSYSVEFVVTQKGKVNKPRNFFIIYQIMSAVFVLSTIIFALLFFYGKGYQNKNLKDNRIWSHFINSKNHVMIVLGDYFMMEKIQLPDSSYNYIYDPKINNQNDFQVYLNNNPALRERLKALGQGYFGEEIPNCYSKLETVFRGCNKNVSMKYSSELTLDDVKENDLIFVGDFATIGILNPFFKKTHFHFTNFPQAIYIFNEEQDTTEFISLNNQDKSVFQNDYAVVANINSYKGKQVLFFVSFLPFGKSEALYQLTEKSFLNELANITSPIPANWSLLMKVSGLQATGFYYEILRFTKVN
ncbi:MAG: hypothetical protein L3J11_02135 [Draconibacterium sp.]|nr:hypothetical protein [Draconibacterium sp.]